MNLSHLDKYGNARMVDVTGKEKTLRKAVASGRVRMKKETLNMITSGDIPKGDVFAVSRVAGISAAKRTPELIPLCHPIAIGSAKVDFELDDNEEEILISAEVAATDATGVEMEALTAVTVSALTIYDMCKGVDKQIRVTDINLVDKSRE